MNSIKRLSVSTKDKEIRLHLFKFSDGHPELRLLSSNFHRKRFISSSNKQKSTTHYYDVLGVTKQATAQQIKNAYYKLSKEYHPDVNKKPGADKMFHEISEAYEILGKESSRSEYDNRYRQAARPSWDNRSSPFGSKQEFKPKYTAPRTGRSPIYNFDEHYRQHYQELRDRKQKDRQKQYEAYKKYYCPKEQYRGVGSQGEKIDGNVFIFAFMICLSIYLFKSFKL